MSETLATYVDRWVSKAASGGLRNPLLKMPVKRFRLLQQFELDDLLKGRSLSIGTSSDPIARNLYKNYDEKIRERGEHTGFLTHGSIEVILAGTTTKGSKRSALMPVWLQRIDLRKQSEKIVAQPVDDPLWDVEKEAMVAAISDAQRQRPPTRHGPALGAVHSIAARRAEPSSPDQTDPFAPIAPSKDSVPSIQASRKQDVLIDELGNLFEQDSTTAPINNPEPTPPPRPKQPTATQPVLLQDWSRRPGWPDTVVGKRVMWGGAWGVITKTERDGKSVFFRDERTKEVLELSADFIRMRSGSSE
jgi:hypothetical protein